MKKFLTAMFLAMLAAFVVSACGDDDNNGPSDSGTDTDTDSDTDISVAISTTAADGPCVAGSVYEVTELDPDTFQVVDSFSDTLDALGRITNVALKSSTPYKIRVECGDFNEITGQLGDGQVLLTAFIITGTDPDQEANVTDITHFLSANIQATYEASAEHTYESYLAIKQAAFAALMAEFSDFIVPAADLATCDPDAFNIVTGSTPCNDIALAVELVIRNYAVAKAATTGESPATLLQAVLDNLKFDFEDGVLSAASSIDAIIASVSTLEVASAQNNLANHLTPLGGTAPTADNVLDTDGDGDPNATDPDIDGDGFASGDDEAPYDSTVGGGMYIDAVNGLGWQVTPPAETYTWADSQTYCDDLVLGGNDDWRMPTISELRSLIVGCATTELDGECAVDSGCLTADCVVDCAGCANLAGPDDGCYWNASIEGDCQTFYSSDLVADESSAVWAVAFYTGAVKTQDAAGLKTPRCVRTI